MEVEFDDPSLDRLETDPSFTAGHDASTVRIPEGYAAHQSRPR